MANTDTNTSTIIINALSDLDTAARNYRIFTDENTVLIPDPETPITEGQGFPTGTN